MIPQAINKDNKPLNDREREFCRLMIPGTITPTEAYRQAGYSFAGAKGNSSRLMAKEGIKSEIRRLRVELAVKVGITQDTQSRKLEDLRIRCHENGDSTGENAAIREQNKLYGLSIDKQQTERTEAQVARTATERRQEELFTQWSLLQAKRAERPTEVVLDDV